MPRIARTFRVRVVEPGQYDPELHGNIFTEVLSQILSPRPMIEDGLSPISFNTSTEFDLITFPEAFAPVSALISAMVSLSKVEKFGCVHVGLRPSGEDAGHLFRVADIHDLVDKITGISNVEGKDLEYFSAWLSNQSSSRMFNIGCIFTIDCFGKLRVCLHPKLVRSQFEHSNLPEKHMHEADMLTLITLHAESKAFFSVTLQPLICSDALNLQTDRGTGSPIWEVNRQAGQFESPPDHIDVVSVATCTPQARVGSDRKGANSREWHQEFRTTFDRAAQDGNLARHHFATFILSNFHTLPDGVEGGLSGVFQPVGPRADGLHSSVELSCYGRPKDQKGNNRWSTPDDGPPSTWDNRGYIAALNPNAEPQQAAVKIFGFNLPNMLRDKSLWQPQRCVVQCEVTTGVWGTPGALVFSKVGSAI